MITPIFGLKDKMGLGVGVGVGVGGVLLDMVPVMLVSLLARVS